MIVVMSTSSSLGLLQLDVIKFGTNLDEENDDINPPQWYGNEIQRKARSNRIELNNFYG